MSAPIGKNLSKPVLDVEQKMQIRLLPDDFHLMGRLATKQGVRPGTFARKVLEQYLAGVRASQ